MDQRVRSFLVKLGLFLSACIAIAGLVGFFIVIKMGVLPSDNPVGHSKEYEQGWSVFFFLLLGVPCLVAFFGGLMPWILWFKRFRKTSAGS
jgi:hypothetical protein